MMKTKVQLGIAAGLAVAGVLLMVASFVAPPLGVVDNSVLVAAGEVFTFSGSLIGVDYHYRSISEK